MIVEIQGSLSGFQGKKDPSQRYFRLNVLGGSTFISVPEKLIPDVVEDTLAKMRCRLRIDRKGLALELVGFEL